jgi:hypothetical protein
MLVLAGLLVASEWRGKRMPRPALPQAKSSQPLSDVH